MIPLLCKVNFENLVNTYVPHPVSANDFGSCSDTHEQPKVTNEGERAISTERKSTSLEDADSLATSELGSC